MFSLQLREDLFTLAQMRRNHIMEFFYISSKNNSWGKINLNNTAPLLSLFVAENRLKPLFIEKMHIKNITPNEAPIQKLILSAVFRNDGNHGADLVELTPCFSSDGAKIIKPSLTIKDDLELIYKYELTGMVGGPEKLNHRLLRYFDTGVNWDDAKSFLFKDIQLPKKLIQP